MTKLTVESIIKKPLKNVWDFYTQPEHIVHWNFAHESWACPNAESDLKTGGTFLYRMEAKDGSFWFDFSGTYTAIKPFERIAYTMDDGRQVTIHFNEIAQDTIRVTQIFEPESQNPIEPQQQGWQAILNNFKQYTETN